MTDTTTFLLVHGSWQSGWAWDNVAARLRAQGHQVLAPTLPGHHPTDEDRASIGHRDYVAAVCETLDTCPGPAVLVGHSAGGAVISQVADQRPDRVAALVYYAAFVLHDGEAIGDVLPRPLFTALQQLAAASPDRSMPMPWELWHDGFMQTAEEIVARRVHHWLTPEPYRPVFEPIRLSRPTAELPVPRTFISCRQDATMPPGYWHPHMSRRLGRCEVLEIDGDHQALMTAPDRLADALLAAVPERHAQAVVGG